MVIRGLILHMIQDYIGVISSGNEIDHLAMKRKSTSTARTRILGIEMIYCTYTCPPKAYRIAIPPIALPGAIIGEMATQWPKEAAWPAEAREHATNLSKYLRDALLSVESAKNQPVPAELVKAVLLGSLSFVIKTQSASDFRTVLDSIDTIRTEQQTSAVSTYEALGTIKEDIRKSAELASQVNAKATDIGEETKLGVSQVQNAKIPCASHHRCPGGPDLRCLQGGNLSGLPPSLLRHLIKVKGYRSKILKKR